MYYPKSSSLLILLTLSLMSQEELPIEELPIAHTVEEMARNSSLNEVEITTETNNTTDSVVKEINSTLPTKSNNEIDMSPFVNSTLKISSFEEAVKDAKESGKKILLEIVEDNCHYCEKMEKKTFSQKKVQDAIESDFVFSRINASKEELPLGLTTQMTPMYVFIDNDENINDMTFGFMDADDFIELLKRER